MDPFLIYLLGVGIPTLLLTLLCMGAIWSNRRDDE